MLLNYLKNSTKIESLVITNNLLTDGCLDILCNYFSTERPIKTVYLSRNYIQPIKCRHRINELKRLNVNLFI
jgi:Ran GTPase-activating protein (RanGAP) involved in mRNA processing and transport